MRFCRTDCARCAASRYAQALAAATTHRHDYVSEYVNDLGAVVDMDAIRGAGLKLCADPLGGAGVAYWARIAERYGFALTIQHDHADPTFRFMTRGLGRQDPYGLLLAVRHGRPDRAEGQVSTWPSPATPITTGTAMVTRSAGLLNPESLPGGGDLLICSRNRPGWRADAGVGKTLVSSSIIDRVAHESGTPAGGSAGGLQVVRGRAAERARWASAARRARARVSCASMAESGPPIRTASSWALLAAEMTARTGRDPGEIYRALTERVRRAGLPAHRRARLAREQKAVLVKLSPEQVTREGTGGRPDRIAMRTTAPGERRGDRRTEGERPRAAGSRRVLRAPRTCISCTRRVSRARSTCGGYRARRRKCSRACFRKGQTATGQKKRQGEGWGAVSGSVRG